MANILKGAPDDRRHSRLVSEDGTRILDIIDRTKAILSDNPKDFPVLTAAHLMGGEASRPVIATGIGPQLDMLMSRDLRAQAVGGGIFKRLRDADLVLACDVFALGRAAFIKVIKETSRPDSFADGLGEIELERAWEIFALNMRLLEERGARMRRRKDWR